MPGYLYGIFLVFSGFTLMMFAPEFVAWQLDISEGSTDIRELAELVVRAWGCIMGTIGTVTIIIISKNEPKS